MKLHGVHHITAITADAPRNVDFYARVLGLRLVKKTVTQDDPTVYHLFYADEHGSHGADLTFFEYPGARRGRPGAGMVNRVVWRGGSRPAPEFCAECLAGGGVRSRRRPPRQRVRSRAARPAAPARLTARAGARRRRMPRPLPGRPGGPRVLIVS